MSSAAPIRVLVADDHPVVRDGLRGQLAAQRDLRVVAEAGSAEEALAVLERHAVDVLLTDLRMPGLGGIELISAVRTRFQATEVVVLSTYDGEDDVRRALAAGARSYLLKDVHRDALCAAVRGAHEGSATYSPAVEKHLHGEALLLSCREIEVLELVARGMTNRQIGADLFIGEATVKTHVQHILAKLGAADRAAAVADAYRRGLF